MDQAPGQVELANLQAAGFSSEEISQWQVDTSQDLRDAGFSQAETDEYFGIKTPDLTPTADNFNANVAKYKAEKSTETSGEGQAGAKTQPPEAKYAETFLESIEAGFDISVTGLMRQAPDKFIPEKSPMFYKIASQVATLAGDLPAMVAGGVLGGTLGAPVGGAIGSVVPVAGTFAGIAAGATVGTGAGAFALPEAMRTVMMEHYEKGDIQSFSDFWERASAVAINSLKAGTIGATTMGAGGAVGSALAKSTIPAAAKTSAVLATEVATMTTVGAALEGKMPEPEHFLEAAILVGGLKATGAVSTKVRNMYAKTGMKPEEVAVLAEANPALKQDLLSSNVDPSGVKPKVKELIPESKPSAEKIELSPEAQTIMSKVGTPPEKGIKVPTFSEFYTNFVDKLDPIHEAVKVFKEGKEITAEQNPYTLARVAVDAKAKAKHFFEKGTIDYATKEITGKPLKDILKKVDSPEAFEAYIISKRAIEKNSQGVQTGFDIDAAKTVVKQGKAKYEIAAKELTEFANASLKYAYDAGVISKESFNNMKSANRDYVPFKRIFEISDEVGAKKGGGKAGSLKAMTGSERSIQSPITSIVENTAELLQMAENNRAKVSLVELAESSKDQTLIKKVKTPMREIKIEAEEVSKQLDIPLDQATELVTFRPVAKDIGPNQFEVFRNGKRQVYETTPELAKAVQSLGGDKAATSILFKLARGVTTVKKIGITFTPDFILRNVFRDYLTSSTFTKGKGMTPVDVFGAMGDIWKKNDKYYEWLKSGGANGAFMEMGDRYVKNDIWKLQRETNFMNSARNVVDSAVGSMRVAAELSEQSIRLAEFKKVRAKGGSLTEAGFSSREITIDFQRVGAKMSALNAITAFQNVSIQGLDRTVRAIKEDPAGVVTKSAAYITAPSVLLWWANHDDPRYQEIPRWEKDLFWIIPTDDWQEATFDEAQGLPEYMVRQNNGKMFVNKGTIYRLPKPQELGIAFGSMPERVLEAYFNENPNAFKDFNETMVGLVTPSFVPDAIAPPIEQYFNKSFFTGRAIVPHHLSQIFPEYQFVEYTSETAKTLGKMVATVDKQSAMASPMVLDNYIQSWGGSLGKYAVQVADKALVATGVAEDKVRPSDTLADVPFVKAFVVRFPLAGSNSVQDFYDNYDESKKVMETIKYLAKEGDIKNVEKEMTLQQNQEKLISLEGVREALSTQAKFIRLVNKNPEILPDEKRQMIDGMYLMMTETAKSGNQLILELKKSVGE